LTLAPLVVDHDYIITRNVIELWLPLGVAVGVALAARAVVGPAVVATLCALGIALVVWNATTPAASRVDWGELADALGPATQERVIGAPGSFEGSPLQLYLDGGHVAKPGERIEASELVLLWLRPVKNYGIGPCFWGADCGGVAYGGSGPPFEPPRGFKLVSTGTTPRITYRIYRSKRPANFPAPAQPGQRNIVVQEPG
jgi:hypothetical protein